MREGSMGAVRASCSSAYLRFIVGLDGECAFGKDQPRANAPVRLSISEMVHDLAYGPAAGPIRCVQLTL